MDSLISNLPESWQLASLGEVCDVLAGPSGARLTMTARTAWNIPVITPKDLQNNRIADDGSSAVAPEIAAKLSRYQVEPGDIVCARIGDLGHQALVHADQLGWLLGSACLRIRALGPLNMTYLIHYLAHPTVRDWTTRNATGSAIPNLTTRTLRSMPVAIPPLDVQATIGEVLGSLDEKIEIHEQISKKTAALRDTLISLLFTGRRAVNGS